ncbi:MAG: alpha/beta hydrolase [Solirubrobacteraceae bacterium]|nr:alpha/beta hydrolase [Patulibacter sp.]
MQQAAFLILHGLENHRPPAHWQFWLAAALAADGHVVRYPSLPDADAPRYDAWAATLERELTGLRDDAGGGERIVIGHSLACLLWLRAAPLLPTDLRPDRVLLVSPPDSGVLPESAATFRLDPSALDPAAIAAASGDLRIACSDRDAYNPGGADAMYAARLGVDADVIPGGGHITPDEGYGPWPSVLAWSTDGALRVGAHA